MVLHACVHFARSPNSTSVTHAPTASFDPSDNINIRICQDIRQCEVNNDTSVSIFHFHRIGMFKYEHYVSTLQRLAREKTMEMQVRFSSLDSRLTNTVSKDCITLPYIKAKDAASDAAKCRRCSGRLRWPHCRHRLDFDIAKKPSKRC